MPKESIGGKGEKCSIGVKPAVAANGGKGAI